MSCTREPATFVVLNPITGWSPVVAIGELDRTNPSGLTLARRADAVDVQLVDRHLPPPRLARGCGPCEWYLGAPGPSPARLLRFECDGVWRDVLDAWCPSIELHEVVAVAAKRDRVAVADGTDGGRVVLWRASGSRFVGAIAVAGARALAFTPAHDLLIATADGRIHRVDAAGRPRGTLAPKLSLGGGRHVERLGLGTDGALWLVTATPDAWQLWRAELHDDAFTPVTHEAGLQDVFPSTELAAVSERGFCLAAAGGTGPCCYDWSGQALPPGEQIVTTPSSVFVDHGQLLVGAIDSGIPRCRWHRVRLVDAEVPTGTSVEIAVSTSDERLDPKSVTTSTPVTAVDPAWSKFAVGPGHEDDWWTAPRGSLDAAIQQPAGRYLYLRLRLVGDGIHTPLVPGIRLDFPRTTSFDFLPAVFGETPEAREFGERFLALFDAGIDDVDAAIEGFPRLLGSAAAPADVLPWLARFFGFAVDPTWDAARLRAILQQAPALYRQRGTVEGIRQALQVVLDVKPAILEPAQHRQWGTLARSACAGAPSGARLGDVRLFGRARARFRLGASALSTAPLRTYGDPQQDPFLVGAHRIDVLVPRMPNESEISRRRVTQLVASQSPAHVVATVRFAGPGFVVGRWSAVGVDTLLGPASPTLLRKDFHLNRTSVLWSGRRGAKPAFRVGEASAVGINTIME